MTKALVIGGGPAGLMAAEVLADAGVSVTICDQKPSFGRKFLMAGKSGLNLTKDEAFSRFMTAYSEAAPELQPILASFDGAALQNWARGLGQQLFTGSTGRVFPAAMKASPLLRAWLSRLDTLGVRRHTRHTWTGWDGQNAIFETPEGRVALDTDATVLALGGASWAKLGSDGHWANVLSRDDVPLTPFTASNAALDVPWTSHMAPHFGAALKSVCWSSGAIRSRGEATLSPTGIEGGGVYALSSSIRAGHRLFVDLIPDVPFEKAQFALSQKPSKLRLTHWLKNTLRLSPVKTALFYEMMANDKPRREQWVHHIKALPVHHNGLRPIDEAISTAGGVRFDALDIGLMLKARPGVFCAGEMLDWDAPTGGYLLTACFSTGRWAGQAAVNYLAAAA
ncbi:MAG: TIGR03862 family flavoprotein [Pseudomonadota bacterium]